MTRIITRPFFGAAHEIKKWKHPTMRGSVVPWKARCKRDQGNGCSIPCESALQTKQKQMKPEIKRKPEVSSPLFLGTVDSVTIANQQTTLTLTTPAGKVAKQFEGVVLEEDSELHEWINIILGKKVTADELERSFNYDQLKGLNVPVVVPSKPGPGGKRTPYLAAVIAVEHLKRTVAQLEPARSPGT
jgi:hypothetical protein